MSEPVLTAEEVRFINLVALRRVVGDAAAAAPPAVALEPIHGPTPSRRAAEVAAALLRPGVLERGALPTALLAVVGQLHRDRFRLVAPQGAAAGMVRELAIGAIDVTAFAAWVEDRAVVE